jgi:hypothetical protein
MRAEGNSVVPMGEPEGDSFATQIVLGFLAIVAILVVIQFGLVTVAGELFERMMAEGLPIP